MDVMRRMIEAEHNSREHTIESHAEMFKKWKVMLGWGLDFICATLELVVKEEAARSFEPKVNDASRRMKLLVHGNT